MSRARTVTVALGVWCLVVALVASLVWLVIGQVGPGVVPVSEPGFAATESLPAHAPVGPAGRPSPGPTLTPRSSATSSPPSSTPTSASTSTPASPPASVTTGSPVPQRRSWSGTQGHVVAECGGATARLVSAYPNTGWRYQILARGPSAVRVRFLRTGQDHGTTVTARCVAGVPHFSVASGEPGDE